MFGLHAALKAVRQHSGLMVLEVLVVFWCFGSLGGGVLVGLVGFNDFSVFSGFGVWLVMH